MSNETIEQLHVLASRKQFRFQTPKGQVSVEDLWKMPLEGKEYSVERVAQDLDETLSTETKKSFVSKKTDANIEVKQKFDLVVHIIEVRVKERDEAQNAKENAAFNQKILAKIQEKDDQALDGLTAEQLRAKLR